MDAAWLPQASFDWLCAEFERLRGGGAALVQRDGARWLRLDQYVGVMECPDGTTLEVLPKHVTADGDHASARRLLRRMLCTVLDIPPREGSLAGVALFDLPLNEWVMARFLAALDELVKRGLRFDYTRVREEQVFLRGRLDTTWSMTSSAKIARRTACCGLRWIACALVRETLVAGGWHMSCPRVWLACRAAPTSPRTCVLGALTG